MSPRLKATRAIEVHGQNIKPGAVFKARPRNATRLVAAGDAEPVDVKGQTGKEAKRTRRTQKNATRSRSGSRARREA